MARRDLANIAVVDPFRAVEIEIDAAAADPRPGKKIHPIDVFDVESAYRRDAFSLQKVLISRFGAKLPAGTLQFSQSTVFRHFAATFLNRNVSAMELSNTGWQFGSRMRYNFTVLIGS
jgi:hypothetical protein